MTSRRELARQEAERRINEWLSRHTGKWWRVPDIANATNLPVPAVNNALRHMVEIDGSVIRDTRRKRVNGKVFPVYQMKGFYLPDIDAYTEASEIHAAPPSWLCPVPPKLTPEQIKGIRTVLGFTGDLRAKKALEDA